MTSTANLESIHVYDQKVGGANISARFSRSDRDIVGVIVGVIAGCQQ